MTRTALIWVALCAFLMLEGRLLCIPISDAQAGTTSRVSVGIGGIQVGFASSEPAISADGRYVAFASDARQLVPGDSNNKSDIFVHDRQTGQTTRVSIATGGGQADESSHDPAISADGRYVAFVSYATNLVPQDTNQRNDIFVHDRQTMQTSRVSVVTGGGQASGESHRPAISADGRYVAFESDAGNFVPGNTNQRGRDDIFVHDRQTGQTTRVSEAFGGGPPNGYSRAAAISADGRYAAFQSSASNLVPGNINQGIRNDIFVHDRQTGQTTRVTEALGGGQPNGSSQDPTMSADGRYVAFESGASNLVPGDTNQHLDIFVFDRQTGLATRVNMATGGAQANDLSMSAVISADGRYVAFYSRATNLVLGDSNQKADIFVHDRQAGQTTRVSVATDGAQANGDSFRPAISGDGRYVAFASNASNLVVADTNQYSDTFVRDRNPLGKPSPPAAIAPGIQSPPVGEGGTRPAPPSAIAPGTQPPIMQRGITSDPPEQSGGTKPE